jgi:hypothetical protein
MPRRWLLQSDFSGEIIANEDQAARMVVEQHPDFSEQITLHGKPDEVYPSFEGYGETEFVVISYTDPEVAPDGQRYVISRDNFDSLFKREEKPSNILQDALDAQRQEEQQTRRRGQRRGGRRQQTDSRQRDRVDYTSPEHAGEPHRGTVSEAEAEYVRNNLEEVNARLRETGDREINPHDPEMAARYRFEPPVGRE